MKNEFELTQMNKLQKASYYLHQYGAAFLFHKMAKKLGIPIKDESVYQGWLHSHEPRKAQLQQQRQEKFREMPEICVVMDFLRATSQEQILARKSLDLQTYGTYRLMEVTESCDIQDILKNRAEIYVFVGRGVQLRPQFLYQVVSVWNQQHFAGLYTDEDVKVGKSYCRPYFKSDQDQELLLNFQYLGDVIAVSGAWLETLVGMLVTSGQQISLWNNHWYELAFRLFESKESVVHLPQILFSKTGKENEIGFSRDLSPVPLECIEASLKRRGIRAQVEQGLVPGFYHVIYQRDKQPLLSIIIPNKDHIQELDQCLRGIFHKNTYEPIEIIVAENNSQEQKTFDYYQQIQQEHENIQVVVWEKEFNYSAINNFAAREAKGELLLFLNNDTEIIDSLCLEELVQCCYRDQVGAAGAMLYYPDNTIQHGGVVLGIGGFAAHALWSLTDRDERYYPYSVTMREFSACTGACLMVQKDVFWQVGGFEEQLQVALNDIDLCMKIRALDKKIIFNPYARMYHYESKSRGYEDSPEKTKRFNREIALFQQRWKDQLEAGDPYYNKNQTLHRADYSVDG